MKSAGSNLSAPDQFERFILCQEGRIAQGSVDVLELKIGIVGKDRFARFAGREEAKQSRHREPKPPDARFAGADCGIDGDTWEDHSTTMSQRPHGCTARHAAN